MQKIGEKLQNNFQNFFYVSCIRPGRHGVYYVWGCISSMGVLQKLMGLGSCQCPSFWSPEGVDNGKLGLGWLMLSMSKLDPQVFVWRDEDFNRSLSLGDFLEAQMEIQFGPYEIYWFISIGYDLSKPSWYLLSWLYPLITWLRWHIYFANSDTSHICCPWLPLFGNLFTESQVTILTTSHQEISWSIWGMFTAVLQVPLSGFVMLRFLRATFPGRCHWKTRSICEARWKLTMKKVPPFV